MFSKILKTFLILIVIGTMTTSFIFVFKLKKIVNNQGYAVMGMLDYFDKSIQSGFLPDQIELQEKLLELQLIQ